MAISSFGKKYLKGVVEEKDFGWIRITQKLRQLDGSYTKVGFPEEGEVKNKSKKGSHEEYTSISEIALIASWLQFGTKYIDPGWPFFTEAFDESLPGLIALRDKLYLKLVKGSITTKTALGLMGEFMVQKIKKKITEIKAPKESDRRIKQKKGVSNPLIDTGQLRNSTQHIEVIK